MSTPACAGCSRQVRLKASSPAGPICSACHARRHTGTCGSCGRDTVLVGRNSDGQPWCNRCYTAATAAHLAEQRRDIVVAAVAVVEPGLTDDAVRIAVADAGPPPSIGQGWETDLSELTTYLNDADSKNWVLGSCTSRAETSLVLRSRSPNSGSDTSTCCVPVTRRGRRQ